MSDMRIGTIAVVGDWVAGWSAAAALKSRVPDVSVAVIPVADLRPGFVDLFGGASPSIGEFHADIGLDERDVLARTGAGIRLGTRFLGWSGTDYTHAYGPAGMPIDGVPFATLWAGLGGAKPFDSFAPAATLAAAGRFIPARGDILGGYANGLQLDPRVYRRFIEAYARHLGVVVTASGMRHAETDGHRVTALHLDDGGRLEADLYIDATNADARLIGQFGDDWQDWSAWLPCDSVVQTLGIPDAAPADSVLPPLEQVEAIDGGWRLTSCLPGRTDTAIVYVDGARQEPGDVRRFQNGRRSRAWIGNVVAIGEAHCVVEPLEAAPLHVLHTQIDRLVASLPDRDFDAVELAYYNRETGQEADRLRDFLILHYATSDRPEPFWQVARNVALPPLLAETLTLFRERGRLPIRDGESFDRDSWHAVLLGQGIVPRRGDVLTAAVDPKRARAAMADFRARLSKAVAAAPTHRAYLASLRTNA
ncbi:tryptophan 7-halogenase [Sphingomonas sp. TWP1-3-1]|jgi:tryptophan halogenase|uniref:tryptophan 7-halogenase n=1 Tax=Sphingomonas sp. TWP1-3-1 TaxID=2804612 RepID=UPI003CEA8BEA